MDNMDYLREIKTPEYFISNSPMNTDLPSDVTASTQVTKQVEELDEDGFPPGRTIMAYVEKIFTPSWFLELPKAVRTAIYFFHFFPKGNQWAPNPLFSTNNTWRIKPPALLQTCRQIRDEALPIYYDEFYVTSATPKDVVPWLKSLDPKARMALSIVSFRWDFTDLSRQKPEKQANKIWAGLKKAGVEVRRGVIEM